MTAILETQGLTKRFGGLVAVNDFDLQVDEGEILGLIGPNGAGKSTVFALVSGFLQVTSGKVIFDGKDITNHAPFRIARAGIARAFQQSLTFQGMTVIENVLVGFHKIHKASLPSSVVRSRSARAEERELEEKAMAILELLGIAGLRDEKPESLPHGHQKALGVAIALASEPKVLLLDEPATGMNPSESDMMISHIRQVRDRGTTVVVVEHDMRVVRSVCDRLVCMNFGQKLCEGDPDYVTSHPEVCEAYLGKELSVLLEVSDMVCKYGAAVALKGVSCGVGEGEIVALVGANGAGKTTLLRTLSGLMHSAGGRITFGGQRIDGRRPHEILKLGVAHVPEGRMVIASMSVLDNIKMGAYLRKDAKQVQADIETMYEHFPVLKERRHQGAGSLSGGEQQMLAVARALMSSPRLVLMDEPSMGLSPKLVETVRDIVVSMHERGLSILLVEQNAVMALSIADRAYVLEVGKVVLEGDAKTVAQDEGVRKAYLGG